MSKSVVSLRLSDRDLQALDHFAKTLPISRSRVIETIISQFLEQDFLAQGAALRTALLKRRDGDAG